MALPEVERFGAGEQIVLVHGGAPPENTWPEQRQLADRFTVVIPTRRGYRDPAGRERQDFVHDAGDIVELLGSGAHLVGFSYGGLGATLAAERASERVRSLTLIEAPLFSVGRGDPAIDELERVSAHFKEHGLGGDPADRDAFLAAANVPLPVPDPPPQHLTVLWELYRNGRSVSEADPDFDALAAAPFPVLVVSGDHQPGLEHLCDKLAERLGAQRA